MKEDDGPCVYIYVLIYVYVYVLTGKTSFLGVARTAGYRCEILKGDNP